MAYKSGRKQTGLISYSEGFKKMVVDEYESSNETLLSLTKKYYIGGNSTIKSWLKQYGKEKSLPKQVRVDMKGEFQIEKAKMAALEKRVKLLEKELADKIIDNTCLKAEFIAFKRLAGEDVVSYVEKKSQNITS